MNRFGVSRKIPIVSLVDFDGTVTPSLSTIFSNRNFGAYQADRQLILGFSGYRNDGLAVGSGSIIGGVNASSLAIQFGGSPYERHCHWMRANPTGTTGNIQIVFDTFAPTRLYWALYRVVGLASLTPTDTDDELGSTGAASSVDIDIAADGFCLAMQSTSNTPTLHTWTGATKMQEQNLSANFLRFSTALVQLPYVGEVARPITCNHGSGQRLMLAISMR